jgi:hypothetical protein
MLDKNGDEDNLDPTEGSPTAVKATPDLFQAIKALKVVFDPKEAPDIYVRCKIIITFGFGDASGRGW